MGAAPYGLSNLSFRSPLTRALLLPIVLVAASSRVRSTEPADVIVKIYSTQLASNYGAPWKAGNPRSVSGPAS